jgi:hypothetical protein
MQAFAESLGFTVTFEAIDGPAGGWCDQQSRRIVVDAGAPPNARLRTLITSSPMRSSDMTATRMTPSSATPKKSS